MARAKPELRLCGIAPESPVQPQPFSAFFVRIRRADATHPVFRFESPHNGEKNGTNPVWTPDGRYIAYQAPGGISYARSDGGSRPETLTTSKDFQYPAAFSPDGKWLAFNQIGPQGFDLWTVSVHPEGGTLKAGKPELFQRTNFGNRLSSLETARNCSFSIS